MLGHFVAKTEAGYALRSPGERLVQAILAGAVGAGPEREHEAVDYSCHFCGTTSLTVGYRDGSVELDCRRCAADRRYRSARGWGKLADFPFPPAGVVGRSAEAFLQAAVTRYHLDCLAHSSGVCPRCTASVTVSLDPCLSHEPDSDTGVCDACDSGYRFFHEVECSNCTYRTRRSVKLGLLDDPGLLSFLGDHGLNVTSRGIDWGWEYEEELLETEPLRGRVTFAIDDEALSLTFGADLTVLSRERSSLAA